MLVGLDLKSLKPAHVSYKMKGRNEFHLIVEINGAKYIHVHGGEKSTFIEFVLPLLSRLQVRLFHPQDAIALSNWGLNPTLK